MPSSARIVGCDLAGISSAAAKSAVAVLEWRGDHFELAETRLLPPGDRALLPDGEFLHSFEESALLVVDSPLQWPAMLRSSRDAKAVEQHWGDRLSSGLAQCYPEERFSLVRDRLCEKCALMNNVPVNNPGVNLGGTVARAIYWRKRLARRATVIETNPDSALAYIGVVKREGRHRWYRPPRRLRNVITLSSFLREDAVAKTWPNVHLRPEADRELRAYDSTGKAGPDKDLLMAVVAGLCGVSYATDCVLLPCTATSIADLGRPFDTDGWIYLPRGASGAARCGQCSPERLHRRTAP